MDGPHSIIVRQLFTKGGMLGSITISSDFIAHVRHIFWLGINTAKHGRVSREGINIFTNEASSAYILCVAAVEAFINELVFGLPTFPQLKKGPMGMLENDWLEKLELKHKLVLFPQLLAGRTFDRGSQPYQDMWTLIRVRNTMVHYKMENTAPSYMKALEDRKVVLIADSEASDYLWMHKLSCTEGIRWANNTATRTVHRLVELLKDGKAIPNIFNLANNFIEISKDEVIEALAKIEGTSEE
jgi:hypothetical protein